MLVRLLTNNNKLLAKWQGPFKVQKKLGSTTYWMATLQLQQGSAYKPFEGRGAEEGEQYLHSAAVANCDLSHLPEDKQLQVKGEWNSEVYQVNPGRTGIAE